MSQVDVRQISRAFQGLLDAAVDVEQDLRAVAERRAMIVRDRAQARVPVDTGATREAIHVSEDASHRQMLVSVGDVSSRNPMVPVWIEYGTAHMPARPFLRPALDENRDGYLRDLDAAISRRLEKAIR